jgi:hypothetical protein
MPSQVRNHHLQNNQEAHLERALAFKTAANLQCTSNVCLPITCPPASYWGWLISLFSIMYQDDDTNQEIGDDDSADTGGFIISSEHRRIWFQWSTGGPSSRSGAPERVIMHVNGSSAKETEPYEYCHCTPSASTFLKSTGSNVTTTAQMPKVIPPQPIIRVWLWTSEC